MNTLESIVHEDELLAIIIRADYSKEGVNFFTPDSFSQQLAYMKHPRGRVIQPHVHNHVSREITYTQEVLVIKRGQLRVDFYYRDQGYLFSKVLSAGDIILLAGGGHGFEVLDDVEMVEVKQGPYTGDKDKTRFSAVSADKICFLKDDKEP